MPNKKNIGLFIPCYIDQFYPQVGIACLELLEKLDCQVSYPLNQTCCGQPLANSGYERDTEGSSLHFIQLFKDFDYIVAPTGSCVLHVKEHFPEGIRQSREFQNMRNKIFELSEFLTDVLKADIRGKFPFRVGYHSSCHGLRGLKLGKASELNTSFFSKPQQLLTQLEGLQWVDLEREDECCGFGGTFATSEEAISVRMGKDRLQDHIQNQVEIVTGGDVSCLMHLEGLAKRQNQPLKFMHIAEILNQALS
ncbi:L-lactate dehydrogenase complex protein LldE [Algoriphagus faecimaris]|uniref:L-lactate dehydrogenase complex protein LldE n=1 Tax=Algoriphagus faecimaris TaxID=686796 RepID=A0A1G6MHP3_9BACT|nr:(Fe-S)-binding protein [Algoriphagus faecimaris]SDC55053.1 L-lactate dehydrogenase complex protein LldE [Algoriphagus faecimaris]